MTDQSSQPLSRAAGRPRIGISSCLLGAAVRYDGAHRADRTITGILGRYFEWVPVCPEVEFGLGVPRHTLRLVGDPDRPRLIEQDTARDLTDAMRAWAGARATALVCGGLSGFIFKSGSPSCGLTGVEVEAAARRPAARGTGLFARAVTVSDSLMPVEEESALRTPAGRAGFINRVFCYRRYRDLVSGGMTREALVRFHTEHERILRFCSPGLCARLERLVMSSEQTDPGELGARYGTMFMRALDRDRPFGRTEHRHA